MAWIESHQDLGRHPKTKRLAKALNVSVVTAIGHLHFLWWWALDYAQDGNLSGYYADEIAEAAMWEDEPETFIKAMVISGFVDDTDSGLTIHDWYDYAGKLIDRREANAEKQKRWRQSRNDNVDGHVTVTSPSRNGATVPNQTVPYQTEPITSSLPATIPPQKPAKKEKSQPKEVDESVYPLCQLLRSLILTNYPSARVRKFSDSDSKRWATDMQRLVNDGRDPPEIEQVIRWALSDDFWKANILSPGKLREKWDTLILQMQRPKQEVRHVPANIRPPTVAANRIPESISYEEFERRHPGRSAGMPKMQGSWPVGDT